MAKGRKKKQLDSVDVVSNIVVEDNFTATEEFKLELEDVVIEKEAIIPESELTEEMKQEEPINTKETAVPISNITLDTELIFDNYQKQFNKEYFNHLKSSGCDYKSYGRWQLAYATMITKAFQLKNKMLLDVGSAYGAITYGFKMCGVMATALDVAQCLTGLTFRGVRFINECAQNMKSVENKSMDFIHASYVLNSVNRKELGLVFSEFKRVLKPNGKILIICNEGDDSERNNNYSHSNHTLIETAKSLGFKLVDCKDQLSLCDDPEHKFIQKYNWNILCFE